MIRKKDNINLGHFCTKRNVKSNVVRPLSQVILVQIVGLDFCPSTTKNYVFFNIDSWEKLNIDNFEPRPFSHSALEIGHAELFLFKLIALKKHLP